MQARSHLLGAFLICYLNPSASTSQSLASQFFHLTGHGLRSIHLPCPAISVFLLSAQDSSRLQLKLFVSSIRACPKSDCLRALVHYPAFSGSDFPPLLSTDCYPQKHSVSRQCAHLQELLVTRVHRHLLRRSILNLHIFRQNKGVVMLS